MSLEGQDSAGEGGEDTGKASSKQRDVEKQEKLRAVNILVGATAVLWLKRGVRW